MIGILALQVILLAGLLIRINQVYRWIAEGREGIGIAETDIAFVEDVLPDDDPFVGPASTPITIVEFSDFGCAACAKVQETLNQVRERVGWQE